MVGLIREALGRTLVRLSAATFTGTDRIEGRYGSAEIRVGKAWLVSRLQALLQTRRILLPDTDEARALARELLDYELRVTDTANVAAGAFRTGSHDDLATALGLAVLDRGRGSSRLTGAALAAANDGLSSASGWNPDAPARQRPYGSSEMVEVAADGSRWERRS